MTAGVVLVILVSNRLPGILLVILAREIDLRSKVFRDRWLKFN